MTAPRTCRQCGADVPPTGRWCRACSEPVRELSPRPRTEGTYVAPLLPQTRTSRWRSSALTFGPFGRVAITAAVILFGASSMTQGFNPAMLWPLGMYTIAATLILKQLWKPVRIPQSEDPAGVSPPERHLRHPVLFRHIDVRLLFGAACAVVLVAAFLINGKIRIDLLVLPVVALVMLAVGLVIAWLSDV